MDRLFGINVIQPPTEQRAERRLGRMLQGVVRQYARGFSAVNTEWAAQHCYQPPTD